jgi:hypothetical protein
MAGLSGRNLAAGLARLETSGVLRLIIGWLLLGASLVPIALREGLLVNSHVAGGVGLAALAVLVLFVLRPRLGSLYAWEGMVNCVAVFATSAIGFTHVLGGEGAWPLARAYRAVQAAACEWMAKAVGDEVAALTTSPLYLIAAVVLLFSFAYKSYKGFLLLFGVVLAYGLIPFRPEMLAAYLLWLAGFWLLIEDPLYLPRRVEERVHFSKGVRDFLCAVRDEPVPLRHALFLIAGRPVGDAAALPPETRHQLEALASTGLVEYDPARGQFFPTSTLAASHTPPGVRAIVDLTSGLASVAVLGIGALYLMIPTDLLPEILLGPIGLLDDLVVMGLSALPLGGMLMTRLPGTRSGTKGVVTRR